MSATKNSQFSPFEGIEVYIKLNKKIKEINYFFGMRVILMPDSPNEFETCAGESKLFIDNDDRITNK